MVPHGHMYQIRMIIFTMREKKGICGIQFASPNIEYYYPLDWETQLVRAIREGSEKRAQAILQQLYEENQRLGLSYTLICRVATLLYETMRRIILEEKLPFSGSMPRGSRHATTFIKLNSAAPSRKRMSPNRSSSSSMAHPRAVLQPVLRAENAVTAVGIIDGVHAVLLIQEPLHGVAVRVDLQKRHCAGQ